MLSGIWNHFELGNKNSLVKICFKNLISKWNAEANKLFDAQQDIALKANDIFIGGQILQRSQYSWVYNYKLSYASTGRCQQSGFWDIGHGDRNPGNAVSRYHWRQDWDLKGYFKPLGRRQAVAEVTIETCRCDGLGSQSGCMKICFWLRGLGRTFAKKSLSIKE